RSRSSPGKIDMAEHAIRPEIVAALVGMVPGKWDHLHAEVAERACYRCEYCDLDFYKSPGNYKLMQTDHITPLKADGRHELENLALACWPCNHFKGQWDPHEGIKGENPTRAELLAAARQYVQGKVRSFDEGQLAPERRIIGWPCP